MAYISLGRFRYRDIVQKSAVSWLQKPCGEDEANHHLSSFLTLVYLADDWAPEFCQIPNTIKKVERPGGLLPWFYLMLFKAFDVKIWEKKLFRISFGRDELLVTLFGLFSFLTMFLGVSESVGRWGGVNNVWHSWFSLSLSLDLLFLCVFIPILLVVIGRLCSNWAQRMTNKLGQEIDTCTQARAMQEAAKRSIPPVQS